MTDSFGTILTAMVTPFDADLRVDHRRLADLARFLIANGSDGLVVAGTTGESPTLTDDEKIAMADTVVEAVGDRCPVVVGTGSNDTAHSIRLTQLAERVGAHAALVVTPYYNKPPERGIIEHFRAVAGETSLPIIIYNIPGRCVVNLSPEALATLSEVENIVAVKQANPDLDETRRLRELLRDGRLRGQRRHAARCAAPGRMGRHLRRQSRRRRSHGRDGPGSCGPATRRQPPPSMRTFSPSTRPCSSPRIRFRSRRR